MWNNTLSFELEPVPLERGESSCFTGNSLKKSMKEFTAKVEDSPLMLLYSLQY